MVRNKGHVILEERFTATAFVRMKPEDDLFPKKHRATVLCVRRVREPTFDCPVCGSALAGGTELNVKALAELAALKPPDPKQQRQKKD